MTLAESLLYAASRGMAILGDPTHKQNVLGFVEQPQCRSLVEAGSIRFPDHARRSSDGDGDCVSCCAKQHNDI